MTMFQFLVEWALRSSILILTGALLLRAFRVSDPSIRLAAWTAILGGSLTLPLLVAVLPSSPLPLARFRSSNGSAMPRIAAQALETPQSPYESARQRARANASTDVAATRQNAGDVPQSRVPSSFDWARSIVAVYLFVVLTLLLRLFAGLATSLRLLANSRATDEAIEGIEIRESERVTAPVTLGIVRSAIVLPADWREWSAAQLEAVLAHERSHVRRRDPAVQLVSVIHRALLWHSPLSWLLHKRIVQAAEEASDDAAVAATQDRTSYAEVLLGFMRGGAFNPGPAGVPMARYGDPGHRVQRILDETTLSRGITRRGLAAIVALGSPLAYVIATAQPQPPVTNPAQAQTLISQTATAPPSQASPAAGVALPAFEIADVHQSASTKRNQMQEAVFRAGRYEVRTATMLDLITIAYSTDADLVYGGPGWLELDRFDVIAKAPPATSQRAVKLMLRSLLADRFKLEVHKDTKPVQGFVLSLGKGKPRMKEADGKGDGGCELQPMPPPVPGTLPPPLVFSCRNVTMEAFATRLRWIAAGYLAAPVLDSTGLKGTWNFDLGFTMQNVLQVPGADGVSLFDAIDKQLGLKLEPGKVPMPVLVVDSVNQEPTANPPEVTALPTPPPPRFEVASVRPSLPGALLQPAAYETGYYRVRGTPLKSLISQAWDLNVQEELEGAPKFVDSARFDIVAKASAATATTPYGTGVGFFGDDFAAMLRALLIDRFKMVTHYEDRPRDAYTLLADKPKLKKADPSNRSGCKSTRPGGGRPNVVATCLNVTMAQFAEQLPVIATRSYFRYPVLDGTGLEGAWDFALTYSPINPAENGGRIATKGAPRPADDEPSGAISLFDAVEKQLGLKLEKHQRPEPVFVIDHIEEKPTDN
jgi:uncharacterized protein (TIGR03435 family)